MIFLSRFGRLLFYSLIFFFFAAPLSWLLLSSIDATPTTGWNLPNPITAANYTDLFAEGEIYVWMINSFILAFGTMIATVLLSTLAAYPLSRVQFRGKTAFMYMLLLARVMPIAAVIVPIFSIAVFLNLINKFSGAILLFTAMQLPISLWIMKGFVDSIPIQLEESAWIDGCSRFSALVRIVFPLMGPGVAVVGLFAFLGAWGDFLIPLVLLRSPDKFPIAMGLFRAFDSRGNADFGMLTALAVFYSMPSVALYLFARQYLVKGLMGGGVKM
jgi:multiple sugar transport system permease protein